jgi:hypothetical protein
MLASAAVAGSSAEAGGQPGLLHAAKRCARGTTVNNSKNPLNSFAVTAYAYS